MITEMTLTTGSVIVDVGVAEAGDVEEEDPGEASITETGEIGIEIETQVIGPGDQKVKIVSIITKIIVVNS